MDIVGLPDAAVKESRERVQAAIKNAGLAYPRKRLVVNLAPASVGKEGPAYDLPIALGVLITEHLLRLFLAEYRNDRQVESPKTENSTQGSSIREAVRVVHK